MLGVFLGELIKRYFHSYASCWNKVSEAFRRVISWDNWKFLPSRRIRGAQTRIRIEIWKLCLSSQAHWSHSYIDFERNLFPITEPESVIRPRPPAWWIGKGLPRLGEDSKTWATFVLEAARFAKYSTESTSLRIVLLAWQVDKFCKSQFYLDFNWRTAFRLHIREKQPAWKAQTHCQFNYLAAFLLRMSWQHPKNPHGV